VAQAKSRLEQDTDGLAPEVAIEHLEATVTRAAVEASRLGFQFPTPDTSDTAELGDGHAPVVIVQRMAGPGEPD
jgi:hypothetical protein